MNAATEIAPETAAEQVPAIALRAQYVKDLSFENPKAPQSLFTLKEPPTMEVALNLGAQRLDQDVFELSIHINARAIADNATIFIADLTYAGVLEVKGIAEEAVEQVVFIQGAFLIYPFARRVISDVTRDGGFPPLQMEPIDFFALYQQNKTKSQSA